MRLSPFLFFFQDPATTFAFHLIYTHNLIHWYLLLILFFVYVAIASLLRHYSWHSFSKSRGLLRLFPSSLGIYQLQSSSFVMLTRAMVYALEYYIGRVSFGAEILFELRDDPKSYLYYYHSHSLFFLQRSFDALEIPFTLLKEWDLRHSHPDLSLVEKMTYEAPYLSAILTLLPVMVIKGEVTEKETDGVGPFTPVYILRGLVRALRRPSSMEKDKKGWILHKYLDTYLSTYFSRKYSSHSWFPQKAFPASQRGNDSIRFEYSCVILPTIIVFIILGHSLSLLYSGSEEITPGLHFTAVGHQWFWSYEMDIIIRGNYPLSSDFDPPREKDGFRPWLWISDEARELARLRAEALAPLFFFKVAFDSIPVGESSLSFGSKRLLEVDNPLVLPINVPLKALATSGDVLHSWAVPQMAIKIDAVPGRINDSFSFIERPGVFYGQCSELCGVGHGFMPIVVEALDVANFMAWAQKSQSQ